MLYFAFGLNMIQRDMQLLVPKATPMGRAVLPDHRTIFALHGYTTVIPVAGETTRGLLWEIPDSALEPLDRFENVENGLYHRDTVTIPGLGEALIYVSNERRMGVPRPGVLKKIQDAGLKAGWDSLPLHWHHFSPGMEFRIPGTHRVYSGNTARDVLTKILFENRLGASTVSEWKEWAERDHLDVQAWSDDAFLFSMIAVGAIEYPSVVDGPLTRAAQPA